MSQNPYAQNRIGGDDFSGLPAPSRMSVLAVISLVCGIIGCVPPLFLLAILLGVVAIFLIAGSKGRVRGTGLAIGGVVLGLIFTAMWVFIGIGAVSVAQELNKTIIMPSQAALTGLEKGDRTALRKMLSSTASTNITDAQIDQFAADVKAEFGSFRAVPDSFMDLFEAWKRAGQAMGQAGQSGGPSQQFNNMIPWPVEFEKGQALLLLEIDNRGSKGGPLFHNIGVARPDMSKEIWLVQRSGGTAAPSTPAPGGATTTPGTTPGATPDAPATTPPPPPANPDKPDETKAPEKKEPGPGGGG